MALRRDGGSSAPSARRLRGTRVAGGGCRMRRYVAHSTTHKRAAGGAITQAGLALNGTQTQGPPAL